MFEKRGRVMAPSNLRQADVPEGCEPIKEMPGTAPGLICPIGEQVIYAVPGVPYEMRAMLEGSVLPDLKRRAGVTAVIKSRVLRTWGHTESGLADLLAERIRELDELGRATLAFQASGVEGIKVRITAKAADDAAAEAVLAEEEARLRALIGDHVFGVDGQTMEAAVLDLLRARKLTLAVAEGLTGGLATMRLAKAADGDPSFRGGLFTESPKVRAELLGATEAPSALGPDAAEALAAGVRVRFGADVGLAATGVIGPEDWRGHAPGTVWLGLAIGDDRSTSEARLPGDPNRIRQYAVISLLDALRRRLLER
jgi:nicotinamide-nucleotide amidase